MFRFKQNAPSGGVSSFDAGIALGNIRLTQPQNGHKTPCATHEWSGNLFILAIWGISGVRVILGSQPESAAVFCHSRIVIAEFVCHTLSHVSMKSLCHSTSQASTGAEPLTESRIFPRPRGSRLKTCHMPSCAYLESTVYDRNGTCLQLEHC